MLLPLIILVLSGHRNGWPGCQLVSHWSSSYRQSSGLGQPGPGRVCHMSLHDWISGTRRCSCCSLGILPGSWLDGFLAFHSLAFEFLIEDTESYGICLFLHSPGRWKTTLQSASSCCVCIPGDVSCEAASYSCKVPGPPESQTLCYTDYTAFSQAFAIKLLITLL